MESDVHEGGFDVTRTQQTSGGMLGRIVGRIKELAGSAAGDRDLAREGRLQQAAGAADQEAEHEAAVARQREAEAELARRKAENDEERRRVEAELAADQREVAIERHRRRTEQEAAAEAAELERRAREADSNATAIDPREH